MKIKILTYAVSAVILLILLVTGVLQSVVLGASNGLFKFADGFDSFVAEHMSLLQSKRTLAMRERVLWERIEELQLALAARTGSPAAGEEEGFLHISVYKTPPSIENDMVLATIPESAAVENGIPVYRIPGVMIGRTAGVSGRTLTISLLSEPGMKTSGRLRSGLEIVLEGQGGGSLSGVISGNVPLDSIVVGDVIFASLPDLPAIAEVVDVELEQHTGDLLVKSRLLANPFLLSDVYVPKDHPNN